MLPDKDLTGWDQKLRERFAVRALKRKALMRRWYRRRAEAAARRRRIAAGIRATLPAVVLVPGGKEKRADLASYPGRRGLDRMALVMAAAGWGPARIGKAFGVTTAAASKWLARRRRPQGVETRQPAWRWRQCSSCKGVGWFYQSAARKSAPGRVFCSWSCYLARGGVRAGECARLAMNRKVKRAILEASEVQMLKRLRQTAPQAPGTTIASPNDQSPHRKRDRKA